MFNRKPSAYVKDIITCCERLHIYTNHLGFDEFASNFMVTEACLYNLQVMGEAITRIPDSIKSNEPRIPWTLIKGTRNRLIHEYFGTDLQIVWDVVTKEIPLLKPEFETIYKKLVRTGQ